MIAAGAAVLAVPMRVLAQPETTIVMTKSCFAGPLSHQLIKTITARRGHQGFLSQKVLESEDSVMLIEEWHRQMAPGAETYSREEI